MGISGDCVASLISYGLDSKQANEIVARIINTMADPNFAFRFARDADEWAHSDIICGDENERMLAYWDVINFLKRTQT